MTILTIKDETATGKILHELALEFTNQYITVRELITARVQMEVEKYQSDLANFKRGLVLPSNLEKRLNGKKSNAIDLEKQIYVALDAFTKNGFFILVDDEQVETLDQQFLITESTQVSFIKLTPLVGG